MTLALAKLPTASSPATQPADWLICTEAAKLLACHPNHLARRCRDELHAQRMAVLVTPPEGGPARWYVRRSFDPRLATNPPALSLPADLAGFTARQREAALARRGCVALLREARRTWPGRAKDWLPELLNQCQRQYGIKATRSRLYAWDAAYQKPADIVVLVDERG